MKIDIVLDVKTVLGEGPLWDVDQERLYWIDSFDGRVFRATADGRELRAWDVPMKIGSMALRNDGKVDKQGRFIAGSMDTMESGPNGALYRVDADLSVHTLDEGIIVSNGPCWSPDGSTFYFADSWSGEIWAYDYDQAKGCVSNRRTFVKLDTSTGGAADGSTV